MLILSFDEPLLITMLYTYYVINYHFIKSHMAPVVHGIIPYDHLTKRDWEIDELFDLSD